MPNLKLIGYVGSALALLGMVSWLYLRGRHDEAAKWRPVVQAAQARAEQAEATTQAVSTFTDKTLKATRKAEHASQAVQKAAGADTPLPPEVLKAWREGLADDLPPSAP